MHPISDRSTLICTSRLSAQPRARHALSTLSGLGVQWILNGHSHTVNKRSRAPKTGHRRALLQVLVSALGPAISPTPFYGCVDMRESVASIVITQAPTTRGRARVRLVSKADSRGEIWEHDSRLNLGLYCENVLLRLSQFSVQ